MTVPPHGVAADVLDELSNAGALAAQRGWVPATSGNFSRRIDERRIAITRSGADKGALLADDVLIITIDEPLPASISAEAPLHVARYRCAHNVGAVLHVHTVAATVLSRACARAGEIVLHSYELHKALSTFTTHESSARIPVFANSQDMAALAEVVEARLADHTHAPGYLLAGHGLYTWGETMFEARRHLEALQFLLECELEERRIR